MQSHAKINLRPSLKKLLAVFFASLLCGCATTSFQSKSTEYSESTPVTAIYLYSFLDLREGNLGKRFLAEVRRQLNDALTQNGIRTKQLWFNDSPLRTQFSLEATGTGPGHTNTRVPVGEVIQAAQDDERKFGASHRLVAFPAYVMTTNTANDFNIRWDLINCQTNQVTWSTTSRSYHMKWLLGDEYPEERAKTFVQGLMSELHKSKVIRSNGT